MTTEEMPTQEQIDAGNRIASDLMDVSCSGLKLHLYPDEEQAAINEYKDSDLITDYCHERIDSVTAIWVAMNRKKAQ
jgi:hypothetical protein